MYGIEALSNEQQSVVSKVQKLLRLAEGTSNEAEASAATNKAMELLAAYNLDIAMLGKGGDDARENGTVTSGAYDYQRNLWAYVAELNFCLCWREKTSRKLNETERNQKWVRESANPDRTTVKYSVMRVVGRKVNVISTKIMTEYLFAALERMVAAYVTETQGPGGLAGKLKSKEAASFREGAASRLCQRLWDRRNEMLKAAEAKSAAETASRPADTANALTLVNVRASEQEANMEFLYPGYGERKVTRDAAMKAVEVALAEKRVADPAWAAAEDARIAKENAKYARARRAAPKGKRLDANAYYAGQEAGAAIGLDPQVDKAAAAPWLT